MLRHFGSYFAQFCDICIDQSSRLCLSWNSCNRDYLPCAMVAECSSTDGGLCLPLSESSSSFPSAPCSSYVLAFEQQVLLDLPRLLLKPHSSHRALAQLDGTSNDLLISEQLNSLPNRSELQCTARRRQLLCETSGLYSYHVSTSRIQDHRHAINTNNLTYLNVHLIFARDRMHIQNEPTIHRYSC